MDHNLCAMGKRPKCIHNRLHLDGAALRKHKQKTSDVDTTIFSSLRLRHGRLTFVKYKELQAEKKI